MEQNFVAGFYCYIQGFNRDVEQTPQSFLYILPSYFTMYTFKYNIKVFSYFFVPLFHIYIKRL